MKVAVRKPYSEQPERRSVPELDQLLKKRMKHHLSLPFEEQKRIDSQRILPFMEMYELYLRAKDGVFSENTEEEVHDCKKE